MNRIFRSRGRVLIVLAALGLLAGTVLWAQRTAREAEFQRGYNVPEWKVDPEFHKDVFTFVRVKYDLNTTTREQRGHTLERWKIDFPDADLNLSFRLQQLTSMKVNPDGRVLELTDKELVDFPFIYFVEPGRNHFTDEELDALRKYLLNGGFMMFDDFWATPYWTRFANEMKRLFPDRPIVDLPLEHPIFHCVFDLKKKPQVPGVDWGRESQFTGITYETKHGPGAEEPHYRAILDDKERIMVMICHNTDLGDGWEREGDDAYYFKEFAEKYAYPLGINILFYAMTH
jgi:hypothetical protein